MGKHEELMDQTQLATDVSGKIKYDFLDKFLVKPLDPIMVKKEFSKPVAKSETPTTDENNIEAVDYDDVETEVKEVESDFRKGVVLKVPFDYELRMKDEKYPSMPIKVGDVVIYGAKVQWFDLLKDTHLVTPYNIYAVERTNGDTTNL